MKALQKWVKFDCYRHCQSNAEDCDDNQFHSCIQVANSLDLWAMRQLGPRIYTQLVANIIVDCFKKTYIS